MIVKPKTTHIDVCFECECGCIHWLDYKYVKRGYELDCFCGKVLEIKPTIINTSFDGAILNTNKPKDNENITKAKKVLLGQGFGGAEIDDVLSKLENDSVEELVKKGLKLL